jgi:IMP dehydrogenase/GMP reductase
MRVHVTAVTVGRHRSYSSWLFVHAALRRFGKRESQPEGNVERTLDGVDTRRDGKKVNEEERDHQNDLGPTLAEGSQGSPAETTRWNALEVLLDLRLTRAEVVRPSASGK